MIRIDPSRLDLREWIHKGDHILVAQGTAEPQTLTEKLVAQRAELGGVNTFLCSMFSDTFQPGAVDGLGLRAIGGVGTNRRLIKAGQMHVVPAHVSQIPALIESGAIGCDVAFIQVSPPDENGRYSLGLAADYTRIAVDKARIVIAEMNRQVPQSLCDGALTEDDIDVLVETDRAPLELPSAAVGDLERQIAAHVDRFIPDRATLQVGIGAIPEAIIAMLSNRKDLGIHSGMVGDSIVGLMEAGVVTNAHKEIDPGITVSGVLFGTRDKLYRFAHRNPAIRLKPIPHTHGTAVLSQLSRFVSVNSAIEVDLTGQVNAELAGGDYVGAVGGQVDYVRAAGQSRGGASIIAFPSTAKGGTVPRIVARLSGPVTTARADVDIIATENGAVRLRGLDLQQRVRAMIDLAAPHHREALARQARELYGA